MAKNTKRTAKASRVTQRVIREDVSYTPAEIREMWDRRRANRIITIMQEDGISYSRAVKRSRRRMINDGTW